jgi:RNA polymerase sigma-70 factor (ECF subfamily)
MNGTDFELMARAYAADLYRFAFWLCRDRWQAQDLVQECFAAAWQSRDSLRDRSAAKSWLFRILRNEHATIYQRKRLPLDHKEVDDVALPDSSIGFERVELEQCLNALPESYREPLVLQVLGGFSGKEIAQMMGISEENVMTRLSRARQALRRMTGHESTAQPYEVRKWTA